MAATKLPATNRFFAPETTKCFFLPVIANANGVWTRAEQTAGDDLTDEIAAVAGWLTTAGQIETPDWGSLFVAQIGGRIKAAASSITFYADKEGTGDVRTVLPRGTEGFIVFCDGGDVPGNLCDVYPVRVTSTGKVRPSGEEANKIQVDFAITRRPFEDVVIPAAAA